MSYQNYKNWIKKHYLKHKKIIKNLNNLDENEIIKYFRYDNLKKNEPNFCPLFFKNKKCHEIDNLNCYLCGCPYIRITKTKSYCSINSKFAKFIKKQNYIHLDCSDCLIPHKEGFIKKYFNKDWLKIMKNII